MLYNKWQGINSCMMVDYIAVISLHNLQPSQKNIS